MPPAAPRPRRVLRLPRSPLTIALAALAVAAVVAAIVVVGPEASAESPGRVVTAKRGVIQSTVSGTGNLEPAHQLDLSFATGGTVKQVYVKQGEHVATGQLIARIDDARQQVAVEQAQAALDIAKTALQDAEDAQSESDDTASAPTEATTASSGLSVVPASTRGTGARIVPISTNTSAPATTTETAPPTTTPESPTTPTGTTTTPKSSKTTTQTTTTPTTTSGGHATTKTGAAAGSGSSSGSGDAATAGSGSGTASGSDGAATDGSGRSSAGGSGESTKSGGSSAGGSAGGGSSTTTVASAKADVTSAELTLKDAQEALEHTRLRAPTSGTITALNGAVGDSVTAAGSSSASSSASDDSSGTGSGTGGSGGGAATGSGSGSAGSGSSSGSSSTAFASLAQLSRLDLKVSFSESDIGKLKVGQAATVTVTALDNVKLAAKVTSIGILSSTSSGVVSYPVTLAVTQKAPGIRPGMSATAEVVVAQATGISVPSQAVTGASVTVQQSGKQVRRAVTTGVVGDSTTQIVSGLQVGDRVVLPALSIGSGSSSGASGAAGRAGGTARLGGGGLGGGFSGGAPSFRRGPGGPG